MNEEPGFNCLRWGFPRLPSRLRLWASTCTLVPVSTCGTVAVLPALGVCQGSFKKMDGLVEQLRSLSTSTVAAQLEASRLAAEQRPEAGRLQAENETHVRENTALLLDWIGLLWLDRSTLASSVMSFK